MSVFVWRISQILGIKCLHTELSWSALEVVSFVNTQIIGVNTLSDLQTGAEQAIQTIRRRPLLLFAVFSPLAAVGEYAFRMSALKKLWVLTQYVRVVRARIRNVHACNELEEEQQISVETIRQVEAAQVVTDRMEEAEERHDENPGAIKFEKEEKDGGEELQVIPTPGHGAQGSTDSPTPGHGAQGSTDSEVRVEHSERNVEAPVEEPTDVSIREISEASAEKENEATQSKLPAGSITAEEAVHCFHALDVKRKGYLNPMNFGLGVRAVAKISHKSEMELFHRYNRSGSGVMTVEEFVAAAIVENDQLLVSGLKRWARLGSKASKTPETKKKTTSQRNFKTPETPERLRSTKSGAGGISVSPVHSRLAARRPDSSTNGVAVGATRGRQRM
jgi:hypothetical protein